MQSGSNGSQLRPSKLFVSSCMVWITCVKILCMRSYRSTDFDVHRNWLAITKNLPHDQWYFDSVNGTTVHTLDYPPGFAYFELLLSSNAVTNYLLGNDILDERCLALLPDTDNEPSRACIVFQRATVIISDLVLWLGAYVLCYANSEGNASSRQIQKSRVSFLLITMNTGLFWLDHMHFQYNGMLLGLLLLSVGFFVRGSESNSGYSHHFNHLMGAITFAVLLTSKHLYLPLAPFYFVYLLRKYCVVNDSFSLKRFMALALVTGSTLILPFLPFLRTDPRAQMSQMLSRLFPFVRGLCHDYWAANVWALYMAADKVLSFLGRKLKIPFSLPTVPPSATAILLVIGLVPALVCAWQNAAKASKSRATGLMYTVIFCSLTAFMLAYHAHEKAIMTAVIPMTYLAVTTEENARLYMRMCALGLFGLTPLLFRPTELLFKTFSYIGFLAFAVNELEKLFGCKLLCKWDYVGMVLLLAVSLFLEVIHPLVLQPHGLFEFLPLMIVSIVCAVGLVGCWFQLGWLMIRTNSRSIASDKRA